MRLFIIPGNPPALHFYQLWAEEIQRELRDCSVHISPYPCLPASGDSSQYLSDMAAGHAQELLAFHGAAKEKIVVVGHSLGGWMALHLLKQHPTIIENCVLLFPFLRKPGLKGRTILRSLQYLHKIRLSYYRGFLEKFFVDLRYLTDQELRTCLTLIYHEHKVIGRYKGTVQVPEQLREKLHMIYCDHDTWCPTDTVNEMKKWISCENLPVKHDFVTSQQERAIVTKSLKSHF